MKWCPLFLLSFLTCLPVAAQDSAKPSPVETAARQVVQNLAAGEFQKVEAQFNQRVAAALPPGKLGDDWKSLLQQVGPFLSIVETRAINVQGLDSVKMVCKFQNVVLDAQVVFDPDGKIAGLNFQPHKEPEPDWTQPTYARPDFFTEQSLNVVNGKFELPGTHCGRRFADRWNRVASRQHTPYRAIDRRANPLYG